MDPFPSIINYGGPPGGIGSSIVKPTYFADTITCGDKPPPSAESKLKLADDADQPVLMCPGEKAKYVCNTDGINVRFDEPTTDEYEVACKVKKIFISEFHKKYSSNSNSISQIFFSDWSILCGPWNLASLCIKIRLHWAPNWWWCHGIWLV